MSVADLLGKRVRFIYTNQRGETKVREGSVVRNSPTTPADYITLCEGAYKSFDPSRVDPTSVEVLD
jgi:hypothetical protein